MRLVALRATEEVALRAGAPGAVRAAVESIDGRPVVVARMDATERRGALSSTASATLAEAARTAKDQRLPLVAFIASSGADVTEGMAALHGWGQAARAIADCSGVVPVIAVLDGPAVSGPALLIGLADFVVMTGQSYAYVSGPTMVAEFTGVAVDNDELGGATAHARFSGAATVVVPDTAAAEVTVAELLGYLPAHTDEEPPRWPTSDPPDRPTPEAGAALPTTAVGSYDVRDVMSAIVDDGLVFELRGRWAPNVVTAFATMDGRPVGILANQPLAIAGTLDIPASQKGARFVAFCDAFNLPIITLVDTPGFYPGKDLEWRGMIRHGAQLVFAYGRATVRSHLRDPAQELRGRVHRHGLQADGERHLPGLAGSRVGGDGRRPGGRHPPAAGHRRAAGGVRGRLRLAPPESVPGRGAGVRRRGDRARRDAP